MRIMSAIAICGLYIWSHTANAQNEHHHSHEGHDHSDMAMQVSDAPESATLTRPDIVAHVNGLVCDFCARSFEKIFGRNPSVAGVKVDLNQKIIALALHGGAALSDAEIKQAVVDAGYELVSVERLPG